MCPFSGNLLLWPQEQTTVPKFMKDMLFLSLSHWQQNIISGKEVSFHHEIYYFVEITPKLQPFLSSSFVLHEANKSFDISFRYDFEEENVYGSKSENGTWVGMVGFVHRQVGTGFLFTNDNTNTSVNVCVNEYLENVLFKSNKLKKSILLMMRLLVLTVCLNC